MVAREAGCSTVALRVMPWVAPPKSSLLQPVIIIAVAAIKNNNVFFIFLNC